MSSRRQSRLPIKALLMALMIVPPITVFAGLAWLKRLPDGFVLLYTGIAATLVVVASFALSVLHDGQLDEWQRSNARFSGQWGWTAGASLMALLLAVPPVRDLIVSAAAAWAQAPNPDQKLVLLTFTFGFISVVIAQMLCVVLLSVGWALWKSRAAREPS